MVDGINGNANSANGNANSADGNANGTDCNGLVFFFVSNQRLDYILSYHR